MGWTDERVELLKKLWMEGFSASQIAAELGDGVTRNAVIGKVHRLKLSGRAKPASAAPRARTAPRSGAPMIGATALKISEDLQVEAYVPPQVQELFIPVEQRLSLLQLSEQTCKWPIGDPLLPEFYFCGQHSEDGKPYCDFHSRRAYH